MAYVLATVKAVWLIHDWLGKAYVFCLFYFYFWKKILACARVDFWFSYILDNIVFCLQCFVVFHQKNNQLFKNSDFMTEDVKKVSFWEGKNQVFFPRQDKWKQIGLKQLRPQRKNKLLIFIRPLPWTVLFNMIQKPKIIHTSKMYLAT